MGVEAFAERARRELLATGETVRKRTVENARRAHRPGGSDRAARPRRTLEPGDRHAAVHQSAHGQVPPAQGLHQARHQLAQRARPRPARRRDHRPAALAATANRRPRSAHCPAATAHSHCPLADANAARAHDTRRDALAEGARSQAPRSYRVSNWLNGPIETQFRTIDGLSIRFAESDDRDDHALLLSPWPESLLAFEPTWTRLAEAHASGGDRPAGVRSFPASRRAALPAGDGRVRDSRRRRVRARAPACGRPRRWHRGLAVRRGLVSGPFAQPRRRERRRGVPAPARGAC